MGNVYQAFFAGKGQGAAECTECGQCEDACPQHLPIIETLKEAHTILTAPAES